MQKRSRFNWGFWLVAALIWLGFQVWIGYRNVAPLSYSDFLQRLERGEIAELTVTETMVEGWFNEPGDGKDHFIVHRVDPGVASELEEYDVDFTGASDQTWLTTVISWVAPVLLFFGNPPRG